MYGIYSIYDMRMKEYGMLMTLKSDSAAKRVFLTSVGKWPDFEDEFKLYKLGEFDPENLGKPVEVFPSAVFIDCSVDESPVSED